MPKETNTVRVGIRGIFGLLGWRLSLALNRHPQVKLTVGIARLDNTFKRFLSLLYLLGKQTKSILPQTIYLDEKHKTVRQINREQSVIEFLPLDQLSMKKNCDIFIDTGAPNTRNNFLNDQYTTFRGRAIILQSGEFPQGQLIAPPLIPAPGQKIYRQGDCIISGLVPILFPFKSGMEKLHVYIEMQRSEKLNDYPISENINATYFHEQLSEQISSELSTLFTGTNNTVSITQTPALDYYTANLEIDLKTAISGETIRNIFQSAPRILLLNHLASSTADIQLLYKEPMKALGYDVSPVIILDSLLRPKLSEKSNKVIIRAVLYYRQVAVLPNIDTINIFGLNLDPLLAMQKTDELMSFKKPIWQTD